MKSRFQCLISWLFNLDNQFLKLCLILRKINWKENNKTNLFSFNPGLRGGKPSRVWNSVYGILCVLVWVSPKVNSETRIWVQVVHLGSELEGSEEVKPGRKAAYNEWLIQQITAMGNWSPMLLRSSWNQRRTCTPSYPTRRIGGELAC